MTGGEKFFMRDFLRDFNYDFRTGFSMIFYALNTDGF